MISIPNQIRQPGSYVIIADRQLHEMVPVMKFKLNDLVIYNSKIHHVIKIIDIDFYNHKYGIIIYESNFFHQKSFNVEYSYYQDIEDHYSLYSRNINYNKIWDQLNV